jgi:hypothetical protein
MSKPSSALSILAVMIAVLFPNKELLAETYKPLVGIVHIHSRASSGLLSLDEIARQAESSGIEAVVLTENFHLEFSYGLPPYPELFRVSRAFPSLTGPEMADYLKSVELINRRHPKVILIPGVEVVPHYFWTGSFWSDDLTMHDAQKNILVTGLDRPEDYKGLPATGNPGAARYGSRSLIRASPLLLVLAGLVLLATKSVRRYKVGGFRVSQRRRHWKSALCLLVIGGAWSAYNAPFTVSAYSIKGREAGNAPYQSLIDHVNRLGKVSIWSYPEAKDYHIYPIPILPRAGKFTIRTDPHPEILLETQDYSAFGAIYRDNTTAEWPGRTWDKTLEEYCTGSRKSPPWGVGELGFHGGGRKNLADVLTIFYVRKPTTEEVLTALSSGRMYAVIPRSNVRVQIAHFVLRSGVKEAVMGETLTLEPGEPLTLNLTLETVDGASHPFRAVLVRNGEPWQELEGSTPFSIALEDAPPLDRRCTYYRLWMRKPHRLVTNPLFTTVSSKIND